MRRLVFVMLLFLSFSTLTYFDAVAGNPSPFGRKAPKKMVSIGLQPSVIFDHGTFVFFANAGYGLTSAIALDAHFGFGNSIYKTYIGGDMRVGLVRGNEIGLDAYVGGHSGGFGSGFDLGAVLNLDIIRSIGIMTAIDLDILTKSNQTESPLHLVLGVDVALARNMGFLMNGEFGLNRSAFSGISGGLIFFL
jgi:hypothetical protein